MDIYALESEVRGDHSLNEVFKENEEWIKTVKRRRIIPRPMRKALMMASRIMCTMERSKIVIQVPWKAALELVNSRIKIALAPYMPQNAYVVLIDKPTNQLDVVNVKWVENYVYVRPIASQSSIGLCYMSQVSQLCLVGETNIPYHRVTSTSIGQGEGLCI